MKIKYTPERIEELRENEVFVFGSNGNGNHAGGAARMAVEKFGAVMGQAEGLQGQSYAIPTLDGDMNRVTEEALRESVGRFVEYAEAHQEKTFYMTKIGCGIAGFDLEYMSGVMLSYDFPENVVLPREFFKLKAYKGFDKNMQCRGFQYEVGKTYEENKADVCSCGFHACENPFDVLAYYNDVDGKYCEVDLFGDLSGNCRKVASTKIAIKADIGFAGLFKAGIEWVKKVTNPAKGNNVGSGDEAQIGSSGDHARIGSSGYEARIGSSGNGAKIGSSGNHAQIGSSGDYAQIGSSGNGAKIGSSGDEARIASDGSDSVICCAGDNSVVRAKS